MCCNEKIGNLKVYFFFSVMSVQGTSALRTQTKIVENNNFNGDSDLHTSAPFLINTTSHNLIGLLKLHHVSKNLRKRTTKSLSGLKRNACYGNACYAGYIKKFQSTYTLAVRRNRRQETVSMPKTWSEITNLDRHF